MKRGSSVKTKLAIGFVVLFLILAILFTFYLTAISGRVYRNSLEEDIRELALNDMALIEGKSDGRLLLAEGFIFEYSGINVSVYNPEGALIAGVIPPGFTVSSRFRDGEIYEINSGNQDYLVYDIYYPTSWEDGVWIRAAAALSDHGRILRNLMLAAVLTLPLFLVLAGVLSYFVSRRALKPLDYINEKAGSINSGEDLKSRINLEGGDREFTELSASMDEMLSRLENAFEKEKQFTSDVSHELRTPVSVIKGAAEYSLKYDESPAEWRQSMEMIRKNSEEMSGMIESLLALSRMENHTLKLTMETLDLAQLSLNVVGELFGDAQISASGDCRIRGDVNLLRGILINLLGNAYKYGGEEVVVKLSVLEQGDSVLLSVNDNGPGIPEEKLPHIFERFYRADDSRSNKIPGAGLGLALVRESVRLHEGDIKVKSISGLGSEFTIIFKKNI